VSKPVRAVITSDQNSPGTAAIDPVEIRRAAMDLLARREHSVRELRIKLLRRFPDVAAVDEQLSRLVSERLLSDVRFAASYARQRISRGYGPLRLREELRERGVSDADAATALTELEAELSIDWCTLAAEIMQKKFGTRVAVDLKEKARRARFMQYRGFAAEHYQQRQHD
jgi:regulatory protein